METFDMAIIGAGPAGMSAAIYAARAGLSVALFEQMMPGGQMGETGKIANYPGFPEGVSGYDLASQMMEQVTRLGVPLKSEQVVAVGELDQAVKRVTTNDGVYGARALVIATGARSRKLGVPGEEELRGKGVSYCATCDGSFFKGKSVIVAGGGNVAAADAAYLARICPEVHLVHRGNRLRANADTAHLLDGAHNVVYHWHTKAEEILGDKGKVCGMRVSDAKTGEEQVIPAAAVFVAVGVSKAPNTELFQGKLPLTDEGYISTDERCATAVPGVYAVGDVRAKALRQVVTAASDGANAAEAAAELLAS